MFKGPGRRNMRMRRKTDIISILYVHLTQLVYIQLKVVMMMIMMLMMTMRKRWRLM
jgi:hypothetical protein